MRVAETLETLLIEVLLDDTEYRQKLQQLIRDSSQFAGTVRNGLRSGGDAFQPITQGAERARKATDPLEDSLKTLNREATNTRTAFQAGLIGQDQFRASMERVITRTRGLSDGLDRSSKNYGLLARASRTAQASLDVAAGRIPRLGLAANVAAANTQVLNVALSRLGPLGSAAIGPITTLTGSLSGLGAASGSAASGLGAFASSAAGIGTLIGVGVVAVTGLAVAGLVKLADQAAVTANEIDKGSQAVGLSTDAYQELRFAFDQSGLSAQQFEQSLRTLNTRIGQTAVGIGEAKAEFDRLGISVRDASGQVRGNEDVFNEIVEALDRLPTSAERAASASRLFGEEAGAKLAALIAGGTEGISNLREQARELGIVLSGTAITSLVGYKDEMNALRLQLQTAKIEIVAGFLPALRQGLIPLIQNVVVPGLQAFGAALTDLTTALQSGDFESNAFADFIFRTAVEAIQIKATLEGLAISFQIFGTQVSIAGQTAKLGFNIALADIEARVAGFNDFLQNNPIAGLLGLGSPAPNQGGRGGSTAEDDALASLAEVLRLSGELDNLQERLVGTQTAFLGAEEAARALFANAFAGGQSARNALTGVGDGADEAGDGADKIAEALKRVDDQLAAIDAQQEIFPNFDAANARIDAVRAGIVSLTNLGLNSQSDAMQDLIEKYEAFGGSARDLKNLLDGLRSSQESLTDRFVSLIETQVEVGNTTIQQAIGTLTERRDALRSELAAIGPNIGVVPGALDDAISLLTRIAALDAGIKSFGETLEEAQASANQPFLEALAAQSEVDAARIEGALVNLGGAARAAVGGLDEVRDIAQDVIGAESVAQLDAYIRQLDAFVEAGGAAGLAAGLVRANARALRQEFLDGEESARLTARAYSDLRTEVRGLLAPLASAGSDIGRIAEIQRLFADEANRTPEALRRWRVELERLGEGFGPVGIAARELLGTMQNVIFLTETLPEAVQGIVGRLRNVAAGVGDAFGGAFEAFGEGFNALQEVIRIEEEFLRVTGQLPGPVEQLEIRLAQIADGGFGLISIAAERARLAMTEYRTEQEFAAATAETLEFVLENVAAAFGVVEAVVDRFRGGTEDLRTINDLAGQFENILNEVPASPYDGILRQLDRLAEGTGVVAIRAKELADKIREISERQEEAARTTERWRDRLGEAVSVIQARLAPTVTNFQELVAVTEETNRVIGDTDPIDSLLVRLDRLARVSPLAAFAVGVLRDRLADFQADTAAGNVSSFLGVGTDFDALREDLDTALAGAKISVEEFNIALRAINWAEFAETAIPLIEGVGRTLGGLQDFLSADSVDDFLGGLGDIAGGVLSFIPGGQFLAPVVDAALDAVGAITGLFQFLFDDGSAAIKAKVDELAANSELLSRDTIERLLVTSREPRDGLLGLLGFTRESVNEEATELGVGIAEGIASGLQSAFNAGSLEDFRQQFTAAMDRIVLEAVTNAFILSEAVQAQIAALTQLVVAALEDGVITAGESEAIRSAQQSLLAQAEVFRGQLEQAGLIPTGTGDGVQGPNADRFELPDVAPGFVSTPDFVVTFSAAVRSFARAVDALVALVSDLRGEPTTLTVEDSSASVSALRAVLVGR